MTLTDLRCADCTAAAVIAVTPGTADLHGPGDLFVQRGEPARAWCLACCTRRGWLAEQEKAA